jgi:hypothetical protein
VIAHLMAATVLTAATPAPLLDFAIEDQFGRVHTDEDCGGAVTLLLGGGRRGVEYVDSWGPALHAALADELADGRVCSVGFAHLKGAPFFVKKKIIASFPDDPDHWTLMDWKGVIARNWGAEKEAANLYLFDRRGRLVLRRALRGFDRATLEELVSEVRRVAAEQ